MRHSDRREFGSDFVGAQVDELCGPRPGEAPRKLGGAEASASPVRPEAVAPHHDDRYRGVGLLRPASSQGWIGSLTERGAIWAAAPPGEALLLQPCKVGVCYHQPSVTLAAEDGEPRSFALHLLAVN